MSEKNPLLGLELSEIEQTKLSAKFRSRQALSVVVTPEETRIKPYIFKAAADAGYETRFYSVARGFTDVNGKLIMGDRGQGNPDEALDAIRENRSRVVWVLLDFLPWITEPIGMVTQRGLRDLMEELPKKGGDRAQAMVIVTARPDLPPEIASDAYVVNWPIPDKAEMGKILDEQCAPTLRNTATREDGTPLVPDDVKAAIRASISGDARAQAIDAAIGLSGSEAASCFASSLVLELRIDPAVIAREKKAVIAKEKLMEWIEPPEDGFGDVGAWEEYKEWAVGLKLAYTPAARTFGVQTPKGAFLVGVSGCGKSLCAKATAGEWGVPCIRLDLNALKDKFVGGSEQNLRKALDMIEALGWCVVWIDEIEKALAGATDGAADGGVAKDALGTILTWMQDRPGDSFVIATANDVTTLPPELMRQGRFDIIWWVDLPTRTERAQITAAAIRTAKRQGTVQFDVDLDAVAEATGGPNDEPRFTGAEIAALVPGAVLTAFADGQRNVNTDDLLRAAKKVTPLAETKKEDIEKLRELWGNGRARPVTRPDTAVAELVTNSRQLDII